MTTSALGELRVLDCSTRVGAAWCGRLLADFGADVVALEASDNPLRSLAPFDDEGGSILGRYVQANKRSLAVDWEEQQTSDVVSRLLDRADIVVLSEPPAQLVARGMKLASIEREAMLRVAVTPHGLSGPLSDAPGNDLTHWLGAAGSRSMGSLTGLRCKARGDRLDYGRRRRLRRCAGGATSAPAERDWRHNRRRRARRPRSDWWPFDAALAACGDATAPAAEGHVSIGAGARQTDTSP